MGIIRRWWMTSLGWRICSMTDGYGSQLIRQRNKPSNQQDKQKFQVAGRRQLPPFHFACLAHMWNAQKFMDSLVFFSTQDRDDRFETTRGSHEDDGFCAVQLRQFSAASHLLKVLFFFSVFFLNEGGTGHEWTCATRRFSFSDAEQSQPEASTHSCTRLF